MLQETSHEAAVPEPSERMKFLFIACPSFSGSTLLSFVLNTHPDIFTIGHMVGWTFEKDSDFRCSCGAPLPECPFFSHVAETFRRRGLPFDFRNFGTRYKVTRNLRLNRYLTDRIPVGGTRTERLRDALVRLMPGYAASLARSDQVNREFVRAALAYSGGRAFVDNGHHLFRLRHLSRVPELDIHAVHLIRSPFGVVNSHRKNHGMDIETAMRIWLKAHDCDFRLLAEFPQSMTIRYEDLCRATDDTVAAIHRLVGLDVLPYTGDFKAKEHHVLGNMMRLGASTISLDERWRSQLTRDDCRKIAAVGSAYVRRHPDRPLAAVVEDYLSQESRAAA